MISKTQNVQIMVEPQFSNYFANFGTNFWFLFINTYNTCSDIDECETGSHNCQGETPRCRNNVGGFVCRKPEK